MAIEESDHRLVNDRVSLGLRTISRVVRVDSAAAPTVGQVLTATADDEAEWQDPTGGGSGLTHPQVMARAAWGM